MWAKRQRWQAVARTLARVSVAATALIVPAKLAGQGSVNTTDPPAVTSGAPGAQGLPAGSAGTLALVPSNATSILLVHEPRPVLDLVVTALAGLGPAGSASDATTDVFWAVAPPCPTSMVVGASHGGRSLYGGATLDMPETWIPLLDDASNRTRWDGMHNIYIDFGRPGERGRLLGTHWRNQAGRMVMSNTRREYQRLVAVASGTMPAEPIDPGAPAANLLAYLAATQVPGTQASFAIDVGASLETVSRRSSQAAAEVEALGVGAETMLAGTVSAGASTVSIKGVVHGMEEAGTLDALLAAPGPFAIAHAIPPGSVAVAGVRVPETAAAYETWLRILAAYELDDDGERLAKMEGTMLEAMGLPGRAALLDLLGTEFALALAPDTARGHAVLGFVQTRNPAGMDAALRALFKSGGGTVMSGGDGLEALRVAAPADNTARRVFWRFVEEEVLVVSTSPTVFSVVGSTAPAETAWAWAASGSSAFAAANLDWWVQAHAGAEEIVPANEWAARFLDSTAWGSIAVNRSGDGLGVEGRARLDTARETRSAMLSALGFRRPALPLDGLLSGGPPPPTGQEDVR